MPEELRFLLALLGAERQVGEDQPALRILVLRHEHGESPEHPRDLRLLSMSSYLVDYPFGDRLYPGALAALERLRSLGPTAILSDGDVVFQPRKIECSGLFEAVERRVLIYIHKERELDDVERRHPAEHYVLVDDKLRILTAVKRHWGARLTTVFVRQGHYARDPSVATCPPADVTIDRIGELLGFDLPALRAGRKGSTP